MQEEKMNRSAIKNYFQICYYNIHFFVLLVLAYTIISSSTAPYLYAFHMPSIPIQDLRAESIEMREKKIYLTGDVVVTYELGIIHCDRAIIQLTEKTKNGEQSHSGQPDRIDLFGSLLIEMSDGSSLSSDRGEIFCTTREAVFYGNEKEKVVYTSFCEEDGKKVTVLAKGKKIIAKIAKDSSGKSTLSDIRGEGAITLEYLR